MKAQGHPQFNTQVTVTCLCGATYSTGSVLTDIKVEVCSNCHPVYTGVKRYVDTLGRVDRFMIAQKKATQAPTVKKAGPKTSSQAPEQKTLKEMLEDAKKVS